MCALCADACPQASRPIAPAVFPYVTNGDFELPLDKKGRIPFWNEEKDHTALKWPYGGRAKLESRAKEAGGSRAIVTASKAWYAVSSIDYPVVETARALIARATLRVEDDESEARLAVVWTDGAGVVVKVSLGQATRDTAWHQLQTAPFAVPPGAVNARIALIAAKPDIEASSDATVWFDDATLLVEEKQCVRVVANQAAYDKSAPKTAIVMTNVVTNGPSGTFKVLDEKNEEAAFGSLRDAGRMTGARDADWGWRFLVADFSEVQKPGRYRVDASILDVKGTSQPFTVGDDALFQATARANVDFFFVQRCGFDVPGWHKACHLDGAKMPDGAHRDLAGGWHSAGDYNKLVYEYGDGGAAYALLGMYEAAPQQFDAADRDGDKVCDVLDEAWWGAKFLAKLQNDNGGFPNHIEQGPDKKSWMRWCPPEQMTDNQAGTADDPIVTAGEGHSPLAIGLWARLSAALGKRGVQNDYLERAVRLWEHATNKGAGTGGADPLLLIAAIDLYRVKDEERFLAYARKSVEAIIASSAPDGRLIGGYSDSGDVPAAALAHVALCLPQDPLFAKIKGRLQRHAAPFMAEAENPFGLARQKLGADGYYFDPSSAMGCNYVLCSRAWSAFMVYRVTGDAKLLAYGQNQLDFLLGKNPYGLCMMEGVGAVNLPRYHHRYMTIPGHERGAVPGAIPNGFVRDLSGADRPGVDLSCGGRPFPSHRTNEPWLVHNVFYTLAVTALHEAYAQGK